MYSTIPLLSFSLVNLPCCSTSFTFVWLPPYLQDGGNFVHTFTVWMVDMANQTAFGPFLVTAGEAQGTQLQVRVCWCNEVRASVPWVVPAPDALGVVTQLATAVT